QTTRCSLSLHDARPISNSYYNDPDLLVYQPGVSLNDCASLEINFTANLSLLELGFVFASTEYPGFTCSNYNDRMGILIKPDTSEDRKSTRLNSRHVKIA